MAEVALKIEQEPKNQGSLIQKIEETHTSEIIIGLCGPIGTNIHFVADELKVILREKFDYDCKIIRLSEFIKIHKKVDESTFSTKYDYFNELISKGNELRNESGNSILAELAIGEIAADREIRKNESGKDGFGSQRVCYIIDSIKNTDELNLFRLIYTDLFYFIGVFSNVDIRENNLESAGLAKHEIYKLVDRDSGEEINFGQKVSKVFLQSDFFLRIDQSTSAKVSNTLTRYLNLVFSSEIITPTNNEIAMYLASAAAGNSACLSRQVGAAISNVDGEVISVGWNDVPKAFGGLYKYSEEDPLSERDFRCMNYKGKCFNDEEKKVIRELLIDELIQKEVISEENRQIAEDVVKKSRIKELIEFSRAVHAEMHALIVGSQNSSSGVIGGKLFCTTYPCHNCARHIIAAGIKEVYYIEPYRKSLATRLHEDSITEKEEEFQKVRILMFNGVAPRRYLEFFKMIPESRKKDGIKFRVDKRKINPKTTLSLQAIPILEKKVIEDLQEKNLIKV